MSEILLLYCPNCNCSTPHAEDAVPDSESATVWHCLICGEEYRPSGGNAPVPATV
jgi:ribosomal protein S27E